ncbi:MAG: CpaF family protein [Actinobacteria bacterium]|nr:CpaF family protein [Actinomycetota bacterium]NBY15130.1 CpaF family protein [Actinomycetota bacterium]
MSGVVTSIDQAEPEKSGDGGVVHLPAGQSDVSPVIAHTKLPADQTTPDVVDPLSNQGDYGALTQFLSDPEIEEIWINSPSRIFVARLGVPELTNLFLTHDAVKTLVERMLATTGRRVDLSQPFVDAMLPDGSRLHVVIPDITREFWTVNIRKFVTRSHSLLDLIRTGSLSQESANFLQLCLDLGLNIIVSGTTGAGKTTMINALLNSSCATDRIITCEEVFELQLISPDWVALQTRQSSLEGTGEITLRRIIKEALRMRPSRLVIGEVRQAECLDLLVAMNSGMPSMCSIHANSARAAISKLCLLPMLAGSNVSAEFVTPAVAASVDVVVHLGLLDDGRRVVHEIATLSGRMESGSIEISTVFSRQAGKLITTELKQLNENLLRLHGNLKSQQVGKAS